MTREEAEYVLRGWSEPDGVLMHAVNHLKSLSQLTDVWLFATVRRSIIGQFDALVIEPTQVRHWLNRDKKKPARYLASFSGRLSMPACVAIRDGVVMASRGLDNVTDVCEAMRADLAQRKAAAVAGRNDGSGR